MRMTKKIIWGLIISLTLSLSTQLAYGGDDVTTEVMTVGAVAVPIEGLDRQVTIVDKQQSLLMDGAVELQESRSIYGYHYHLPDGRRAALISAAPVNYKNSNGTYELVDDRIIASITRDDYAFTNAANSFSVYFPDYANSNTDILSRGPTGARIYLWSQGEVWYESPTGDRELLHRAEASEGIPEENTIRYPDRYPDVTELFRVKYEGIKHNYVIGQVPSFVGDRFSGTIEFCEVVTLPANSRLSVEGNTKTHNFLTGCDIQILDPSGNFLGVFPTPWAHEGTDRSFEPEVDAELKLTYRVTYLNEGKVQIAVLMPLSWLTQPGRTYPITIDPSSYYYENHSYDDCYSWGSTLFNYSAEYMKVGYTSDYGMPYYLAYMTWHDVTIPAGSTIDYVALYLRAYDNYSNTCSFRWQFEDADNAQPCAYEYPASRYYVDHYNYSSSYTTSWTSGSWYGVQDFSAGLQDVIDRSGWSSGNNVGMKWCAYSASGGDRYIYSYDYSSGSAPYLYVEYAAGKHDVALDDFWFDSTPLPVDQDVTLHMQITNEGDYTEEITTINYTWVGPLGQTHTGEMASDVPLVSFAPGETKTVQATIHTSSTAGTYDLMVAIPAVPGETDTGDNTRIEQVQVGVLEHDVALDDFWFDSTPLPVDQDVTLHMQITNEGDYTEEITTINYTWVGPLGQTHTGKMASDVPLVSFAPGETKTVQATIHTPSTAGTYDLMVAIPAVPGETDTGDNTRIEQVQVGVLEHDVALDDFWFDSTPLPVDQDVTLHMQITNEGDYTEEITTVNYSWQGPLGQTHTGKMASDVPLVSFAPGETKTVQATIHTPSTAGTYDLMVAIPAVPGETDTGDNTRIEQVQVGVLEHDVALYDFWFDSTPLPVDQDVTLHMQITNEGDYTEEITTVNYSWQGPLGQTHTGEMASDVPLVSFAPGETKTVQATIHTPSTAGTYNLTLTIPAVPGETDTGDNTRIEQVPVGACTPDIRIEPTSLTFTEESSASTTYAGDPTVLTETISNGLVIRSFFTATQLKFETNGSCQQVFLEGGVLPEDEPGTPWLPAKYVNVIIPTGAKVASIKTSADEVLIAEGIDVCPVQPPVRLGAPAPTPTGKDVDAYALDTKVPARLAEVTGHHTMRGFTYVSIRLNPVRYIPARQELYLAENLNVTLELEVQREPVIAPATNNGIFKSMIRKIVVNGDMLDTEDFTPRMLDEIPTETVDYLIITSSALQSTFQTLADHRASHNGFSTSVVTLESIYQNPSYDGDDNQEEIRNCIEDYVNNKSTAYVVLGGDDEVVPDRDCYVTCSGYTENNMPTDLYYAGLDSSWDEDGDGTYGEADTSSGDEGDLAPDVLVGRIPVRSTSQALDYIDKLIDYENNPPSEDFKEKFLILGDELWDQYTGTDRPSDALNDGFSGFMDHSPVSDAEMWLRRLYRDGIQPDWEPSTLSYFFDTLTSWDSSIPGDYLQDSSNVFTRFNEGWYNVLFDTHGNTTIWGLESGTFSSSSASALSGRTTIIYTTACLTGHFDGSTDPCLSEAFLRNDAGGALAYFGCSRYGWGSPDSPPASNTSIGGPSIEYAYEFYDQLLNSGQDILGQVFSQHKASLSGSCGSNGAYRWVQFGMNYQGDPAFSLSDSGGSDSFTIYNDGNCDLEITSMSKRDGDPWLDWAPTAPPTRTIAPGRSQVIIVSIDWGQVSGSSDDEQIIVYSNDDGMSPYPNAVFINATKQNHDPELTSGDIDPDSGDTSTTFSYTVHYYDQDGDSPSTKYVYIDGSEHPMSLYSGSASDGTYRYQTTLSSGIHNYYFYFSDGKGGSDRLPSSGTYSGPSVSPINLCRGDFDTDGDVDGSDLAVFAGGVTGDVVLEDFAADFGRTDCLN